MSGFYIVSSNSSEIKPPNNYRAKETQLIISLKFHYAETLKDIPIDVAVDAMVKVWESCQPKQTPNRRPGMMTERPRRIGGPNTIHL